MTVGLNNNISGHLHTAYGAVSKREIFQVGDTELQIDGYSIAYFSFDVSSIPFGYTATAATLSFIVSDCNMNAFALGNMTVEPLDYGTTFEPADALIAATATGKVVARSESDVGTISIDVLDWVNKDLTARHSNLSQYRIRFATTQNNDGRNTSCAIPNSTFIAPVVPSLSMSVRQP
ncbi:MAG: hypothetical protein SF187_07255 [Deltaproteobacteria bacterium]|nr:hypothetical protein [Deltaproteobacteria bacterium]